MSFGTLNDAFDSYDFGGGGGWDWSSDGWGTIDVGLIDSSTVYAPPDFGNPAVNPPDYWGWLGNTQVNPPDYSTVWDDALGLPGVYESGPSFGGGSTGVYLPGGGVPRPRPSGGSGGSGSGGSGGGTRPQSQQRQQGSNLLALLLIIAIIALVLKGGK